MEKHDYATLLDYIGKLAEAPGTPVPQKLETLHQTCREHMESANAKLKPVHRVRILLPMDFKDSLLSIRRRLGEKDFKEWFSHTTYDAPKFVDALLRLRAFGNDTPVFRLDVDVLFNRYTLRNMWSVRQAVSQGVKDFKACVEDPYVQSFLVSQQYSAVQAGQM